jgi:methylphosphotriester-DNA--protein-cysteine methyltransferase
MVTKCHRRHDSIGLGPIPSPPGTDPREEARRLLAGTDLPVREVARACGLPTAHHFVQVFKAATGMTPTAYRQHHATPAE